MCPLTNLQVHLYSMWIKDYCSTLTQCKAFNEIYSISMNVTFYLTLRLIQSIGWLNDFDH